MGNSDPYGSYGWLFAQQQQGGQLGWLQATANSGNTYTSLARDPAGLATPQQEVPPPAGKRGPETALEWLDRRVSEMCVAP